MLILGGVYHKNTSGIKCGHIIENPPTTGPLPKCSMGLEYSPTFWRLKFMIHYMINAHNYPLVGGFNPSEKY